MNAIPAIPEMLARNDTRFGSREVTADRFTLTPGPTRFDGQHVMVLDDTWTSGSRTQSAALLLRQRGAAHVSVMTVARWIDPGWADNATFIRTQLTTDFDPYRCPVTGTTCP